MMTPLSASSQPSPALQAVLWDGQVTSALPDSGLRPQAGLPPPPTACTLAFLQRVPPWWQSEAFQILFSLGEQIKDEDWSSVKEKSKRKKKLMWNTNKEKNYKPYNWIVIFYFWGGTPSSALGIKCKDLDLNQLYSCIFMLDKSFNHELSDSNRVSPFSGFWATSGCI